MDMFKVGDEVVVKKLPDEIGRHGGYYSGDVGVVSGTYNEEDGWVLVDFPNISGFSRDRFGVDPNELRHLTPLEKAMK